MSFPYPLMRAAVRRTITIGAQQALRYIPVTGTNGWEDPWALRDDSPFSCMMAGQHLRPVRATDGRPFRWTTRLNGVKFWGEERDWEAGEDALYYFAEPLPYADLIFIAHSHGGQLVIKLAASGLHIRTLVTVGTPVRKDVPTVEAAKNIGQWIHIFDLKRDWTQWWGQVGDLSLKNDRSFLISGVQNDGVPKISHSNILKDPEYFDHWNTYGWIEAIKQGPSS
jgi:pimeloyl-ACP methyl ester carboxylesterase